jgi:integrase
MARSEGAVIARRLGRALSAGKLTRRGDVWTLDWKTATGERRRQALSRDRRVAERMRIEIVHQRDLEMAGLGAVEGQSRPLAEVRDAFLADLGTRTSTRYHAYARQRIDDVLGEIRAKRVCDLRAHELLQLRAQMLKSGLSCVTANHKLATLQGMLNWALKVGLIAENPIRNMPRLPQPESARVHRRRAMSEDEIARFLAAAGEDDRLNLEHLAAVKTIEGGTKGVQWSLRRRKLRVPQAPLWRAFLECGCRFGEMTRAVWADVDLDRRTIFLRAEHTKSGRSRHVPLLDGLVGELRALRETQALVLRRPVRPDDRIFMTPEGCAWPWATNGAMRVFDRVLEAAGIDRVDAQGRKLDIHALRHTFASRLARRGVPLQKAQRLLGHSDPKLTAQIYTHVEVEDLRDAVETIETDGKAEPAARRDAS